MKIAVTLLAFAAAILGMGAIWVGWSGSYLSRWDEFRGVMARLELLAGCLMIVLGLAGAILIWTKPRIVPVVLSVGAAAGILGAIIALVVTGGGGGRSLLYVIALTGGASAIPAAAGAWLARRASVTAPA